MSVFFVIVGVAMSIFGISAARNRELTDVIWTGAQDKGLVAKGISRREFDLIVTTTWYGIAVLSAAITLLTLLDLF